MPRRQLMRLAMANMELSLASLQYSKPRSRVPCMSGANFELHEAKPAFAADGRAQQQHPAQQVGSPCFSNPVLCHHVFVMLWLVSNAMYSEVCRTTPLPFTRRPLNTGG